MAGATEQAARRGPEALSRDQVLDAAFAILESQGERRLTIRQLANQLGVAVTAVYWHVGDKQALLDGLVDRVVERVGVVQARGADPGSRVTSVAKGLRRTLRERPDLVAFVHRQGRTAELFMPARRILLRELLATDLPPAEVVITLQALLDLVIGSVLLDRQVQRQPEQRRSAGELWATDDVDDADMLALLRTPADEDQVFAFMLDVLVAAVA